MTQRQIALEILLDTYKNKEFSNLNMQKKLKELPEIQRPFVTELVNGVIRHDLYLKHQFQDCIKKDTKTDLYIILMMAYYEKIYLNEKDYAIVNEYVNLAGKGQKPFINSVLRNNLNNIKKVEGSTLEDISLKSSLPLWIIKLLNKQYTEEEFNSIVDDYLNVKPVIFYHLNCKKASKSSLAKEKLTWLTDTCFTSERTLINHPIFKRGGIYVQDIGSQMIASACAVKEREKFLDACAAPGSKTFNIAEKLEDLSNIVANDKSEVRLNLIKSKARVLGLDGITYTNIDGTNLESLNRKFNVVLCDVPCSGLGVIKRKPDLKLNIKPEDLDDLVKIQKDILNSAYNVLKDNGRIIYSTCTLNKKENERQVKEFLESHLDMQLQEEKIILPKHGSDGFYYAVMTKKQ